MTSYLMTSAQLFLGLLIIGGNTREGAGDLPPTLAEQDFECLPENEEPQSHGNNIWEWLNRVEEEVEKEGRFPFEEDLFYGCR